MVKKAQGVVKALAASRRKGRSEPAVSCSEVNTIAIKLIKEVMISPASPEILVFSNTIIASGTVVCTVAEKVSLAEVDPLFEEAVVKLETEIETASGKDISRACDVQHYMKVYQARRFGVSTNARMAEAAQSTTRDL